MRKWLVTFKGKKSIINQTIIHAISDIEAEKLMKSYVNNIDIVTISEIQEVNYDEEPEFIQPGSNSIQNGANDSSLPI